MQTIWIESCGLHQCFPDDTQAEYDKLKRIMCAKRCNCYCKYSFCSWRKRFTEVAQKVIEEIEKEQLNYQPLYQPSDSIEHKINVVAKIHLWCEFG